MKTTARGLQYLAVFGALFLSVTVALNVALNAQISGTGAITGKVTDSSGAIVPQAEIQVTNIATGLSRTVSSNSEGWYTVQLLPPGTYALSFRRPGFAATTVNNIQVAVTETTVVDIQLKVGTVMTEVEVTGAPELVQTASAALGRVTSERLIVALPLANRNFTQILALSPGSTVELSNAGAIGRNTQNVSVNGSRPNFNSFQLNGIEAVNITQNSASGWGPYTGLATPAPDTIAEFKVQTATFDAGYGRSAGATVDIVSKSGTNNFHGSVWEFFRNDALNANDFFLNRNQRPKPILKQNQFGFTLGGPIRKDKLFFFGSYQGTRQVNGVDPSQNLRSTFLPPLTNDRSRSTLGAAFGGQAGARGGVAVARDGSNINPVALALLNLKFQDSNYIIPTPQVILPSGVGSSTFSVPGRFSDDQFTTNIDYRLSTKNNLAGRFFYTNSVQNAAFDASGGNVPGWGASVDSVNHVLSLTDTHQISAHLLNEFGFGYLRFVGLQRDAEPISKADAGISIPNTNPALPSISVSGLFSIGPQATPYSPSTANTFVYKDTVSYLFGKHSLRTGVVVGRYQIAIEVPFASRGSLSFLSFPDFLLGMSAAQNGSAFSNISSVRAASGLFAVNERYSSVAAFVQDDIRLTPRFTLNAGLRYEYFSPPSETHGRLSNFDRTIGVQEPPTTGTYSGVVVPSNFRGTIPDGVTRLSDTALWPKDFLNVAPRLGFALHLLDKPDVVLRAGYGIYYQQLSGQPASQTVLSRPFVAQIQNSGTTVAAATFQNPIPGVPALSSFPSFVLRTPTSQETSASFSEGITTPYVQQYSLGIQYGFARNFMLEVGYVGSKSTHLPWLPRFNQALIATSDHPVHGITTTTVQNVTSRTPWLGESPSIIGIDTTLNANYNSLQTSVTKRFSSGLQFLASYTWSKNLDYSQGIAAYGIELNSERGNQADVRTNYGPSAFDRTHRFVLSFVYDLPNIRRGPRALQQVLSGWEISGTSVLQSGTPFSVIDSRGSSIYGIAASYAQCIGGISRTTSGSIEDRLGGYLKTSAFQPAPALFNGTGFGNCARNNVRGPDQRNLDFSLQKSMRITEKSNLLFRTEFFNLTNTPKFGQPAADISAPQSFGVISSTVSNPRIIQFALKYGF
jgi:hypothetical protein